MSTARYTGPLNPLADSAALAEMPAQGQQPVVRAQNGPGTGGAWQNYNTRQPNQAQNPWPATTTTGTATTGPAAQTISGPAGRPSNGREGGHI